MALNHDKQPRDNIAHLDRVIGCLRGGEGHHAVLGVPRDANKAQLDAAYRTLCVALHPDNRAFREIGRQEDVTRAFQAVSQAYNTLKDPERKAKYMQQQIERQLKQRGADSQPANGPIDAVQAQLKNIRLQIERRRWAEAEQLATRLSDASPGAGQGQGALLLGRAIYNNEANAADSRTKRAHELWQQAYHRQDASAALRLEAAMLLANSYRRSAEPAQARDWAGRALQLDARNVDAARIMRLLDRSNAPGASGRLGARAAPSQRADDAELDENSSTFGRAWRKGGDLVKRLLGA